MTRKNEGDPLKIKIVIPSAGRPDRVKALSICPNADIVVPKKEYNAYRKNYRNETIIAHPDDVLWITAKRNRILDFYFDKWYDCVFQIDDDCISLVSMIAEKNEKNKNPSFIENVIYNSAIMAKDLGTPVFCYNNLANVMLYQAFKPFTFKSVMKMWAYWIMNNPIRFDERIKLNEDIDYAMQVLVKHRIIFVDNRYAFEKDKTFGNSWWCSLIRTTELQEESLKIILKKRWKALRRWTGKNKLTVDIAF